MSEYTVSLYEDGSIVEQSKANSIIACQLWALETLSFKLEVEPFCAPIMFKIKSNSDMTFLIGVTSNRMIHWSKVTER